MADYEIIIETTQMMTLRDLKLRPSWRGEIVYRDDNGKTTFTGISRVYFQSSDPDKKRVRGSLFGKLGNLRRYLARTGKRWELEQIEAARVKKAQAEADKAARLRLRDAAPALLEALQGMVEMFEGICTAEYRNAHPSMIRARAAIALATTTPAQG